MKAVSICSPGLEGFDDLYMFVDINHEQEEELLRVLDYMQEIKELNPRIKGMTIDNADATFGRMVVVREYPALLRWLERKDRLDRVMDGEVISAESCPNYLEGVDRVAPIPTRFPYLHLTRSGDFYYSAYVKSHSPARFEGGSLRANMLRAKTIH